MGRANSSRLKELQAVLAAKGLDACVITKPVDQGFITGYYMEGYVLLVSRKKAWAFLPLMLLDHFREQSPFIKAEAAKTGNCQSAAAKAESEGFKKVAFDLDNESYLTGKFWKTHKFIESASLVAPLREIKKGEEIKTLRKSCHIAAEAFRIIRPRLKPGRTERSIANELEDIMQRAGARGASFDIIVGSGPNSALPHHCTGARTVKNNEPLLLDFGCKYEYYCSDITRTIFLGKPSRKYQEIYSIVERAHRLGLAAVKSGVKASDVDKACRDEIARRGYADKFIHGTGHGVGLEIHESPRVNAKSAAVLKPGMAITVEPGIYLAGQLGVRIEDSVLVTGSGCEILTK